MNIKNYYYKIDYFYGLLNCSENSSVVELKSQYRNLMLKYHPDKNNSPEAAEYAKEINEAYNYILQMRGEEHINNNENNIMTDEKKYNTPWGEYFDCVIEYEARISRFLMNLCSVADYNLRNQLKEILSINLTKKNGLTLNKIINYIVQSSITVKKWAVETIFQSIDSLRILNYIN